MGTVDGKGAVLHPDRRIVDDRSLRVHRRTHPLHVSNLLHRRFVWIGLCLPPRSSLLFVPVTAAAYLLPVWREVDTVGARDAAFVVLPVCVLIAEVVARAVASVRAARGGMERLLAAAKQLVNVSSTKEATDLLADLAFELLEADAVVVFLTDPEKPQRLFASASCNVASGADDLVIDIEAEPSGMGTAIHRRSTLFVSESVIAEMNPRLQRITGAEAGVFFPLAGQNEYVGAITAVWTKPKKELDSFAQQAIELLSLMAGRVVDRLRAAARLSHEAERDPLTGLFNRRSFQPLIEASQPGDAVVLIDLDRFKQVNDRYGHAEGDIALVALARCLESTIRDGDAAARLGGEEFGLLLGRGDEVGAAAAVERLRVFWARTDPRTTFSAGIAVRRTGEGISDTLGRADAALYAAKNAGRNRTEISLVPVA